jgi:DNA-binding SARP family transcriptional activator
MRFRVLGPLQITDNDRPVPLSGINQRATLGYLLLYANNVVATSQLLHALWGEASPPTARKILQNAVSSLRRTLAGQGGGDRSKMLVTHAPGYVLRADPATIDSCEFQELARKGQAALTVGQWEEADCHLRQALALWNGPALADLVEDGYDWPELTALQNARFGVLENRMEAALAVGRHLEVVAELETVVRADPLREHLCQQLMVALYRSGRQADALSVYRRTRAALVEQLGLDPGPELRRLERAILDHDPSLARCEGTPARLAAPPVVVPEPAVPEPGPDRRTGPGRPGDVPFLRLPPPPACGSEEHKRVTAVFVHADTSGSTASAEVLGRVLERARSAVREQVCLYGGRNHGSMGPVTLALFGTGQTQEDDALRAVRMALEAAKYSDHGIRLRIAVAGGEALVLGAHEAAAGGEPVSVTGRFLETGLTLLYESRAGVVRVCDATRDACSEHFGFAAAGAPEGGHDITAVLRPRLVSRTDLPLVQRDRELKQLGWWLEEVRASRRPHLVTVLGVAGIGKSRLMHELHREIADGARVRCLIGCNRKLGLKEPYTALAGVVRSYAGISDEDSALRRDHKLDAAVRELVGPGPLSAELADNLRFLVAPGRSTQPGTREPERLKAAFAAWRRFVEELAAREPLVIILEDLNRVDDTLLKFVGHLTEHVGNLPLLVVVTARPELVNRAPYWAGGQRNATTMSLEPLPRSGIDALLRNFLGTAAGGESEKLRAALAGRSGGNPLFAIEYARMVEEDGPRGEAAARPVAGVCVRCDEDGNRVPLLVHNIISARLDTLPQSEKALLYEASTFDGPFYGQELVAVGDQDPAELQEALESLEKRDFLRRTRLGPELNCVEYEFVHELVSRVAYSRLPHAFRADRHRRAAEWLAGQSARPLTVLVHHCRQAVAHARQAELPTKDLSTHVCGLLIEAAQRATERDAPAAARYCYRSALEFCSPGDPTWHLLLRRQQQETKSPA